VEKQKVKDPNEEFWRGPRFIDTNGGRKHQPGCRFTSLPGCIFSTVLLSFWHNDQIYPAVALPSLVVAFWRALFVSLGLLALFGVVQPKLLQINRSHWPFMLLFGLTLATFNSAWTFSVQFNGAAIGTVLAYSSPAFIALLSRWLLSEKITGVKIISIILTFIGIILVACLRAKCRLAQHFGLSGLVFRSAACLQTGS
jgi:uncharacterized membrane protein